MYICTYIYIFLHLFDDHHALLTNVYLKSSASKYNKFVHLKYMCVCVTHRQTYSDAEKMKLIFH